jgi:hypothetical protein
MERHELTELHYLTPITNLPSITTRGILSHTGAAAFNPASLADEDIQNRRLKRVPGGRPLHDYVNLYICGRGPMLYKRLEQRLDFCVLRVSPEVLDIAGTIVTDKNAAGDHVRYAAAPAGLSIVNRELTFAEYWTSQDTIEYWRLKAAKCAEVLVPDCVGVEHIGGAYVCSQQIAQKILELQLNPSLPTSVNGYLFFNRR